MFLEKLRASALKWENWLLSASAHCSLLARGRIVHLLAKDRQQGMKPFSPHQTLLSPTTPPSPKSQTKETQERVQRGQEGWRPWQLPTTNAGYSSSSKHL